MELALSIVAVGLVIWFLTTKTTRKAFGATVEETAKLGQQSVKITRATSFKEATDEYGDLLDQLDLSDKFIEGSK